MLGARSCLNGGDIGVAGVGCSLGLSVAMCGMLVWVCSVARSVVCSMSAFVFMVRSCSLGGAFAFAGWCVHIRWVVLSLSGSFPHSCSVVLA